MLDTLLGLAYIFVLVKAYSLLGKRGGGKPWHS